MSYIIKMALDIKAGFEPPAPMTSPLEAYCAVGTIARAMKLGMPERRDTHFEIRDQLAAAMAVPYTHLAMPTSGHVAV